MTDIKQAIQQKQRESDINEIRMLFDPFEKPDSLDMQEDDYLQAHKNLRRELREIEDNSLMRQLLREDATVKRERDKEFIEAIKFVPRSLSIDEATEILKQAI